MHPAISTMLDRLSAICGVFFFCLTGSSVIETRPILAAVAFTLAVMFPSIVTHSREQYMNIFGKRPTGGADDRQGK